MSRLRRIQRGDFETKIPFPNRPQKALLQRNHTADRAREYADELDQYEKDVKKYEEDLKAYTEDKRRLHEEFRLAAFRYCNISDHEKRERAWSMAWDHGHSSGYNDVLLHLEELSELLV